MSAPKRNAPANGKFLMYNRFFEFERVVSKVVVTEEGIYKDGQVPESYGGARLELEIVDAVFMVNSQTEMQIFEFANAPALDADGYLGGPIERDGEVIGEHEGPSDEPTIQTTVRNPNLDDTRVACGEVAKSAFYEGLSRTPSQPKS